MRILVSLLALLAIVIVVAMTVAPNYPQVRDVYRTTLCPMLDKISTDICAAVRRDPPSEKL